MVAPQAVLLATANPAKRERLRWLLEGLPVETLTPAQVPGFTSPEESGGSYRENAEIKALHAARLHDGLALASDGGVTIPALGSRWNGLFTARAAGPDAGDAAKAQHLLGLMAGKRGAERRVVWNEAAALAGRNGLLQSWEETGNEGVLTEEYDPSHAIPGFWVYSLWYYPELGKRYVDLTPEELERVDVTWGRLRARIREWWEATGAPGTQVPG